jgi:hypothetical protein
MNEKPLLVSTETPEFVSWLAGATKLHVDYMATNFPNNPKEAITHNNGKRYIRVMRGGSAHAFIDRVNGDVLKPATWSAPAKGARGNIFDTSNGLAHMSAYGPAYKRNM